MQQHISSFISTKSRGSVKTASNTDRKNEVIKSFTNFLCHSNQGEPFKMQLQGFPGGPVVKTLPSSAGGVGSIPDQETKVPDASGPEKQNIKSRSNIVTNSINTLNTVHIKKKLIFKIKLK